jgi:hypothetical protein
MQEGDRTAWYKAAMMTIGEIPLSLLRPACAEAAKVCDHPSKIVPFICKYQPDSVRWALKHLRNCRARVENLNAPQIEKHDPEYVTAEELAGLRAEMVKNLSAQE